MPPAALEVSPALTAIIFVKSLLQVIARQYAVEVCAGTFADVVWVKVAPLSVEIQMPFVPTVELTNAIFCMSELQQAPIQLPVAMLKLLTTKFIFI